MTRSANRAVTASDLVARLRALRDPVNIAGQQRFGIRTANEQLGISLATLRAIGRPLRGNHTLALELWETGIQECRLLATIIDDPARVSRRQMDRWASAADNWALTDALGFNLFDRTPHAQEKALAWSERQPEFLKRTAFAVMAGMAVHRPDLPDAVFLSLLPVIARESTDERNCVRKAVNWALRQIGKRTPRLRRAALAEARRIQKKNSRAACWVAADALRELLRR